MKFSAIKERPLNVSGFSRSSDEIKKGAFSEIFGYSSNMKIKKSGKEIKEALQKILARTDVEKENHYKELVAILEECDEKPVKEPSEYLFSGVKSKVDLVPKMFSYEKCCQSDPSNSYSEEREEENLYEKYNDHARQYIEACVEIVKMKAMIANLNDKQKYELTLDQIAMLGLKNED